MLVSYGRLHPVLTLLCEYRSIGEAAADWLETSRQNPPKLTARLYNSHGFYCNRDGMFSFRKQKKFRIKVFEAVESGGWF